MNHSDTIDVNDHVWQIMLDDSTVQDGDFSHFRVGAVRMIYLSFFGELSLTTENGRTITSTHNTAFRRYFVVAEIVEIIGGVWVIDFGFRAARERGMPEGAVVGEFVAGEIDLGVDIASYLYMKPLTSFKSLSLRWRIKRITKKVAPLLVATDMKGVEMYSVEDETRAIYEDLPAITYKYTVHDEDFTKIQFDNDDDEIPPTQTTYLLDCQLVDGIAGSMARASVP